MTQIVLSFDAGAMSALRAGPGQLAAEVKTAAVVQWYAECRISQGKAAEILGISRARFLDELYRRRVPAVQTDIDELREEFACLAG
jgi:predicted HTH domain antitoxin